MATANPAGPAGSEGPAGPAGDTWVVVPLYNEASVVGDVVAGLRRSFTKVVCVDDASTDGSGDAAARAGATVVRHPVNLGQGAALQTGIEWALADADTRYLVTFDSDGQHQVADAVAMVDRLRRGDADVVIGSRFLDERTRVSATKRAVLRAAVLHTTLTTGVRMTDAHNGLRAMTREVAASLDITQNRMAHASEIVEQLGKGAWRWVEHPVHVLYTDYSKAKGQSVLNSVNIVTDLIFR